MSNDLSPKLLLLLLLSVTVSGCDRESSALAVRSPSVVNVNVIKVTRVEGAIETSAFFGTLKPNRQSQLRFGKAGRIKSLLKEVGQKFKSGEQIASLELEQLEQQKSDVEKSIEEAQGVQGNQASLGQLQAQLAAVELELEKGNLVAPYDCVIATQNAAVGDLVSPQSPIVTIVEELPVLVEANLPLEIAQGLDVGSTVWIVIGEDSVKAAVKSQSLFESTVGSRIVSFQVTDPIEPASWSFGQTVKILFLTSTDNTGYWIPVSALARESTGLWSALVATKGAVAESESNVSTFQVRRKMLEIVQLEDEWALAQGSLGDGEFVIVNGTHRIVPGQTVKTVDVSERFTKPGSGDGE